MKPNDIKVGATYSNRGAGKTHRKVLGIGPQHRPDSFFGAGDAPNEDGVLYEQRGQTDRLYISSFAAWCGKVVE